MIILVLWPAPYANLAGRAMGKHTHSNVFGTCCRLPLCTNPSLSRLVYDMQWVMESWVTWVNINKIKELVVEHNASNTDVAAKTLQILHMQPSSIYIINKLCKIWPLTTKNVISLISWVHIWRNSQLVFLRYRGPTSWTETPMMWCHALWRVSFFRHFLLCYFY